MGSIEDKLSARQGRILDFINQFYAEKGYPPSVRDIVKGCHLSSTSVAHYNLKALERRGLIRRQAEISRGLEIINRKDKLEIPVMGYIAAGKPISVPQADGWAVSPLEYIEVSPRIVGNRPNLYGLMVKGTSMVDALVGDGDLVIVEPAREVDNGQMAVIWLRSEEKTTLKKFYPEGTMVRLQPANSRMKPIYVAAGDVEIQGRIIAVIRKLA